MLSMEAVKALKPLSDPSKSLGFTGTTLSALRKELTGTDATLLGFVGTPWTLAAYAIEGKAEKDCKETKVRTKCGEMKHSFLFSVKLLPSMMT